MVQHRNTKNDPIAAAYALSVVKEPSRPGFRAAMVNLNPALALSLPSVFTVELEANSGSRHVRSQCITARAPAESPFTVSGTGVRHAWALSYVASESSLHAAIRPLRSSQLNRRGGSSVPRVRPGWQPQPRDAISPGKSHPMPWRTSGPWWSRLRQLQTARHSRTALAMVRRPRPPSAAP